MMGKLIKIGINFNKKMSEKNISAYAASTAFFIFLSLVPMLMVICTMIPYTPLTEENLTRAITEVTPDQIDPMVTELIRDVYQRASHSLASGGPFDDLDGGEGVDGTDAGTERRQ